MATTYFRVHQKDDDPQRLLDPDNQKSEPWGGTVWGRCDKCGGTGKTEHVGGVTAECPACEGTGEIDPAIRRGISVFPRAEGRLEYMRRRETDIDGELLVELEGVPSEDEDFDADEGALLIHPTRIVDVRPLDHDRIRALAGS